MGNIMLFTRLFVCPVFLILLIVLSSNTFAATFTVTNLNDSGPGSLRQAILDSNATPAVDDDIVFQAGLSGTIFLTSGLMLINDSVTITGPGADVITIDAQMNSRIFDADGFLNVISIIGLKLINGSAAIGGAILISTNLSIDSCVFENNSATFGGAIYNAFNSTVDLIANSLFDGNSAQSGGAIYNANPITEITNCAFINNIANQGGAIENTQGGIIEVISYSTFSDNTATLSCGAICNSNVSTIDLITDSIFTGNSADAGGAIGNSSTIKEISNCTFNANSATSGSGGAVANGVAIEKISNSTFSGNNSANTGGAISNVGIINISFSTIDNNSATAAGGAIYDTGTTNIRNCIVAFNTAPAGPNCNTDIATEAPETNNYSNDASCGFDFDNSTIVLSSLGDNGGPTETVALISGDPLDGASAMCDPLDNMGMATGVALLADQRFFSRPEPLGTLCDAGSFETQPTGMLTIAKTSVPAGGTDFQFSGTGFPQGCLLKDNFSLDDMGSLECVLPVNSYTVEEVLPDNYDLEIMCTKPPSAATQTSVTIELAQGDEVTCDFINTLPIALEPLDPAEVGVQNTLSANQATPNEDVTFIWSFGLNAPLEANSKSDVSTNVAPDDICPGLQTPLNNPRILATVQADSNGDADFSFNMPLQAEGLTIYFQAVDIFSCKGSNVNEETIGVPPQSDIMLQPLVPGTAGQQNTISATDATPNDSVRFIWGFNQGIVIADNVCPGYQSGIINPRILTTVSSNGSGNASHTFNIPNAGAGLTVVLQAVDLATCTGSNVNAENL